MTIIVVTGTDTDVGKTVATAALAVRSGRSTLVVKPVQTGVLPDEAGDASAVAHLAGCRVSELVRLREPLAPESAARVAGVSIPTVATHAATIRALAASHETVIVEGAGGLLVRLDSSGDTLIDLACSLSAAVVVVVRAGLGTLNHTELTVAALRSRGIEPMGLIVGSWPSAPDLASRCNLEDLPRVTGVPLLAVIPAGAGAMGSAEFCAAAPGWFAEAQAT